MRITDIGTDKDIQLTDIDGDSAKESESFISGDTAVTVCFNKEGDAIEERLKQYMIYIRGI